MKYLSLLILSFALLPTQVFAVSNPISYGLDGRMRYVNYEAENVTNLEVAFGYAGVIELEEGEEMKSFFSGDESAWIVSGIDNFIAIKPITDVKPETNVIIISTLGRKYVIDLKLGKAQKQSYGIKFVYPSSKKNVKRNRTIEKLQTALDPNNQTNVNYNYWADATPGINIERMFDNGTHTFIKTAHWVDLPIVYEIRADGTESVANVTVKDDWIIIPKLSGNWRLRSGKEVACIVRNHANYTSNDTGKTASKYVYRELK